MDPYETFQPQAVKAIVKDFTAKPSGRFLLVIPTGGGKTFTAMRAIGALFQSGVLVEGTHQTVWVAHREELLDQAKLALKRYNARFQDAQLKEGSHIVFSMMGKAKENIQSAKTKFVVFDEAHHGAAPKYYEAVFEQKSAGILGLTATPSRHDGKPLDFERESFSIGFPDLVKLSVLTNPTIIRVEGVKIESVTKFSSEEDLELLNTAERDARLIQALLVGYEKYQKVIVYVGTKKHARALYERMLKTKLPDLYISVSWVFGGVRENSRGVERDLFFRQEKERKRSILINVDLLTEGYDDPSVNTVVMAAPCKSKLYCFQVVGRAVRRDPENPEKRAFVLEVVDDLPNIRYRMDNRWLFSDVSDALEPRVEDLLYSDVETFDSKLLELCKRFSLPTDGALFPEWNPDERYTLLLFKRYLGKGEYGHMAVPITSLNRLAISNAFNYLSERMADCVASDIQVSQARQYGSVASTPLFGEEPTFGVIYQAMRNQQTILAKAEAAEFVTNGYPWVTFVSLRFWQAENAIPTDLLTFIEPCFNKEELLVTLRARSYSPGSSVVRLPLPLGGVIGRIMPKDEVAILTVVTDDLRAASGINGYEQSEVTLQVMSKTVMPIETRLHSALLHIVRDNYEWKKEIN
jgi:superfamily II DNA or RNA helicase